LNNHVPAQDVNGDDWLAQQVREFEEDPDYVAERMALEITEQAARLMKRRGQNKSALAKAMGVSRAYVTRVFHAPPNLTLRSIAQLSLALGVRPVVGLVEEAEQVLDAGETATTLTFSIGETRGCLNEFSSSLWNAWLGESLIASVSTRGAQDCTTVDTTQSLFARPAASLKVETDLAGDRRVKPKLAAAA
jgi:transcriptional regulator with XRE-family HTH domain